MNKDEAVNHRRMTFNPEDTKAFVFARNKTAAELPLQEARDYFQGSPNTLRPIEESDEVFPGVANGFPGKYQPKKVAFQPPSPKGDALMKPPSLTSPDIASPMRESKTKLHKFSEDLGAIPEHPSSPTRSPLLHQTLKARFDPTHQMYNPSSPRANRKKRQKALMNFHSIRMIMKFMSRVWRRPTPNSMKADQLEMINDQSQWGISDLEPEIRRELPQAVPLGRRPSSVSKLKAKTKGLVVKSIHMSSLTWPNKWFQFFRTWGEKICSLLSPIHPDSIGMTFWTCLCTLALLLQLFYIPLTISFEIDSNAVTTLLLLLEVFFLMDIFIRFNAGFWDNVNMVILDRRRIFVYYLFSSFLFDLVTAIPFLIFVLGSNPDYPSERWSGRNKSFAPSSSLFAFLLQLLHVFKIYRLPNLCDYINKRLLLSSRLKLIFGIVRLAISIFFTSHLIGCLYHVIAITHRDENELTWLSGSLIENSDWTTRYTCSLLWSVSTVVNIGNTEFLPSNNLERIYTVLIQIFSSGVFAYIFFTISQLLRDSNRTQRSLETKLEDINLTMRKMYIDQELQGRIRQYLTYIWDPNNTNPEDESQLIASLSSELRDEIVRRSFGKTLLKSQLLTQLFSSSFLEALSVICEQRTYAPSEMIIDEDDDTNHDMFFIRGGEVEAFLKKTSTFLTTLQENMVCGEIGFFSGAQRTSSVRSVTLTRVVVISPERFEELIRGFPIDHEKYCQIRDSVSLYDDLAVLKVHCAACSRLGHVARDCSSVHYNVNRRILTEYYLMNLKKLQKSFERTTARSKFNSLRRSTYVRNRAQSFRRYHVIFDDIQEISQRGGVQLIPKNHSTTQTINLTSQLGQISQFSNNQHLIYNLPHRFESGNIALLKQDSINQADYSSTTNPIPRLMMQLAGNKGLENKNTMTLIHQSQEIGNTISNRGVPISEYTNREVDTIRNPILFEKSRRYVLDSHSQTPSRPFRNNLETSTPLSPLGYRIRGNRPKVSDDISVSMIEMDNVANFKNYFPYSNATNRLTTFNHRKGDIVSPLGRKRVASFALRKNGKKSFNKKIPETTRPLLEDGILSPTKKEPLSARFMNVEGAADWKLFSQPSQPDETKRDLKSPSMRKISLMSPSSPKKRRSAEGSSSHDLEKHFAMRVQDFPFAKDAEIEGDSDQRDQPRQNQRFRAKKLYIERAQTKRVPTIPINYDPGQINNLVNILDTDKPVITVTPQNKIPAWKKTFTHRSHSAEDER